jgi:peptidoglycan/xylan/chitin deacetylase (PgdA/CDA1 family)
VKANNFRIDAILVIILTIVLTGLLLPIVSYSKFEYLSKIQSSENPGDQSNNSVQSTTGYLRDGTNKVVIVTFDDSIRREYLLAKPILDKYGFKATFFEVCNWIGSGDPNFMTWQDVAQLQKEGYDIESHSMTHANLNHMSTAKLNFEIGQSKQCLLNHGINPTIFAYPYGQGSSNSTVVNTVAKYYYLARTDSSPSFPLAFLHCDNKKNLFNLPGPNQISCKTYSNNGMLNFENRYSINSWSHRHIEGSYDYTLHRCINGICMYYNDSQMMERFIAAVNSQDNFNKDGIRAISIVIYHNFVPNPQDNPLSLFKYRQGPVTTSVNLFDKEMKYLHDDGFKVLTMADLGYDANSNYLYIKK